MRKIALLLLITFCASVEYAQNSPTHYQCFNLSKLICSVEYFAIKISEDYLSVVLIDKGIQKTSSMNKQEKEDFLMFADSDRPIQEKKIIFDRYAKYWADNIPNDYTLFRPRNNILKGLIETYNKEPQRNIHTKEKHEYMNNSNDALYSLILALFIRSAIAPRSNNGVYYNGLYFQNDADMEDYKNVNGLK